MSERVEFNVSLPLAMWDWLEGEAGDTGTVNEALERLVDAAMSGDNSRLDRLTAILDKLELLTDQAAK